MTNDNKPPKGVKSIDSRKARERGFVATQKAIQAIHNKTNAVGTTIKAVHSSNQDNYSAPHIDTSTTRSVLKDIENAKFNNMSSAGKAVPTIPPSETVSKPKKPSYLKVVESIRDAVLDHILEKADPCWKGYKMLGMKKKSKKSVPNCIPVSEDNPIQEANIKTIIRKSFSNQRRRNLSNRIKDKMDDRREQMGDKRVSGKYPDIVTMIKLKDKRYDSLNKRYIHTSDPYFGYKTKYMTKK